MKKVKTIPVMPSPIAPAMSSCRKVGASEGGIEAMPWKLVSPKGMPTIAVMMMPMTIDPGTPRAESPAISRKPAQDNSVLVVPSGPSPTSVAG